MKNISFLFFCILFYACTAQTKQKSLIMETFNVAEFEKNKVADEYSRSLEDGTRIIQFENSEEYVEKSIPSHGWFYTLKIFYKIGRAHV